MVEDFPNKRDDDVSHHFVVHAVLAVEILHMSKMLGKLVLAVDQCIPIGKEAPTQGLVFTCDAVKQVLFHIFEVLDDFFGDGEEGLAICSGLKAFKGTHHQDISELGHV